VFGEKLNDLVEALERSDVKRGLAAAIDGIDVHAGREAQLDGFDRFSLRLFDGRSCLLLWCRGLRPPSAD